MPQTDFYKEMVCRNIGVLSDEEQERLRNSCVCVAGAGGMGGLSAEQFVRLGVGHVKIADFDRFQIHNISRQFLATTETVDRNKVDVLAEHFMQENPELELDVFSEGVTVENAEEFIEGASVVIDGTDYTRFGHTVAMYEAARKKGICVVCPNAIGFGAQILVFGPKTKTLAEFLNVSENSARPDLARFVQYIPSYADKLMVASAAKMEINIPNIIMPQHLGTSIAVTEAVLLMLGKIKEPEGKEPRVFIFDVLDRKFEVRN